MNCAEKLFAGHVAWYPEQSPEGRLSLLRRFRGSDFINVQNVQEYLESLCHKSRITIDDFPEALPPWANSILFFTAPELQDAEFACFLDFRPWKDLRSAYSVTFPDSDGFAFGTIGVIWNSFSGGLAVTPGAFIIVYDKQGTVLRCRVSPADGFDDPDCRGVVNNALITSVAACSFANCKNTTLKQSRVSRQVKRCAERKNEPVFRYYELAIEPIRKILEGEGGLLEHGDIKRSLHICRGHFSSYGSAYGKGKLFGRLEGRFWIPRHARGSFESGVVSKDYRVTAAASKANA